MGTYDLIRKIAQSSLTEKGREVNRIKTDLLYDFESAPFYHVVEINGVEQGVHIIYDKNKDYKILSKPDESLSAGDIVTWDNEYWLIARTFGDDQVQTKGIIIECNNTLNLYQNNILYEIPCAVESSVQLYRMGYDSNQYLSIPSSTIVARIPYTSITSQINRNNIYKLGLQNYEVVDLNDIIEPGILVLKMEYSQKAQDSHKYILTILNGSSTLQIAQSQSLTIVTKLTDNDEIVDSPSLIYSSSDDEIATIDENGVVSILDLGLVTFTIVLESDETVSDSIEVEIIEDEVDNYTVEINGLTSIIKGYAFDYNCVFKNNGNVIVDTSVFYLKADDGIGETSLAEITSQDGAENTCVIQGSTSGYVKLFVKNIGETVISEPLRIQIKNLF